MANISISLPVGIRNGTKMLPNKKSDLDKITGLLDSITVSLGGTREAPGIWMTDRDFLIIEVATAITAFQLRWQLTADGAVDPGGGTLKKLNALASGGGGVMLGVTAHVVRAPSKFAEEDSKTQFQAVDVTSMAGAGRLRVTQGTANFVRRLVRIEGSSINWVGVLFPRSGSTVVFGSTPHIFFTPLPSQGHYYDPTYDSFGGAPPWWKLWHDYTWGMGRQIQLAGADQVLVIPFYRNSQHKDLGSFLSNWKEVVEKAVTVAIDSVDPLQLRGSYTFDEIVTSSFSNGYIPHSNFNGMATGAARITQVLFDLDGQAAKPPSHWRPPNGVIYLNARSRVGNPVGNNWYVGERFQNFYKYWPGGFSGHQACASYLLYHGVWQYCT